MKTLIVALILGQLSPAVSLAAYISMMDRGTNSQRLWLDQNSSSIYTLDVIPEPKITSLDIDKVLSDPESKLPEEFRISPALREITRFWLSIYTQYDSKQTVVFDETHPEMIYEVMDFHDLERRARNRMAYEIMRERKIKKILAEYKKAFESLSSKNRRGKRRKLSETEDKILSAISRLDHKHSWKELKENLKIQTGQRDAVADGLASWEPFAPKIENLFRAVGVPTELARLSLVESSFNLKATSKVGAVGVWQFMESSGKHFLKISPNEGIDERRSPIKAAVAAARMLKQNYRGLKSWPFAVIAYNSGMKKIIRNPKTFKEDHGLSEVIRLCRGPKGLGWAGKNYFPEFLAMLHAEKYRDHFFQFKSSQEKLHGVSFVHMQKPQSLLQFALKNGYEPASIYSLNPDIRFPNKKVPKGTLIAIPNRFDKFQLLLSTDHKYRRAHSG